MSGPLPRPLTEIAVKQEENCDLGKEWLLCAVAARAIRDTLQETVPCIDCRF